MNCIIATGILVEVILLQSVMDFIEYKITPVKF